MEGVVRVRVEGSGACLGKHGGPARPSTTRPAPPPQTLTVHYFPGHFVLGDDEVLRDGVLILVVAHGGGRAGSRFTWTAGHTLAGNSGEGRPGSPSHGQMTSASRLLAHTPAYFPTCFQEADIIYPK